ncbi:hypothetical protein GCM10011289_05330 [Paludibacterium paludis]|uniref:Filamentous hemagglutinin n=1 Tax=Paludibacterium paludis TaxID=1225769 RepID=A0A918NYU5_9NEIS|nr:hypothetical protein GCM10011289_05330 [Paludibacterium paludis]
MLAGFGAAALAQGPEAAPGGPTVSAAPNGVTVVQIAAPSAGGVSHNRYERFDVPERGVILNNSAGIAATGLAGFIDGNAALKGGAASLILNEVIAPNPSRLAGYLEVAGQRAEVVIANPWGITCAGCGFINAERATLTTGRPVLDNGLLAGYRVEGGTLRVDGQDLDVSGLDSFTLIGRALQLNRGVYAKRLEVVLGRNEVDKATLAARPLAAQGGEGVALDVAALGGMYAGAIRLTSSEAGFAVNSRGRIAATAGAVHLNSAGDITLVERVEGRDAVAVRAAGTLTQQGDVRGGSVSLEGAQRVRVDGGIVAQGALTVTAGAVDGAGAWVAGAKEDGTLDAGGLLTVQTSGALAFRGQWRAGGSLAVSAGSLELSGMQLLSAHGDLTLSGRGDARLAGASAVAAGTARLTAGGRLDLSRGVLDGAGLALAAHEVVNDGGTLTQRGAGEARVSATAGFANRGGRLAVAGDLTLDSGGTLNNDDGTIEAAGRLTLTGAELLARHGRIAALGEGAARLTFSGAIDASDGRMGGNGDVHLRANRIDSSRGAWSSDGTLTLQSGDWTNQDGTVTARRLTLTAADVDNRRGTLAQSGAGLAELAFGGRFDNSGGTVTSRGALALRAGDWTQLAGRFQTAGAATIKVAGQVRSTDNSVIASGGDLALGAGGVDNRAAAIESGAALALEVGSLSNGAGRIQAVGGGASRLTVSGALDNRSGAILSASALSLAADTVRNDGGKLASGGRLTLTAGDVANAGGLLQGAALSVSSRSFANSGTVLASGGEDSRLDVDTDLQNRGGRIHGAGTLRVTATTLGNGGGELVGRENLAVRSERLEGAGVLGSDGDVSLAVTGDLQLGASERWVAGRDLTLAAGGHTVNDGTLVAGRALHWQSGGDIANRGGAQGVGELDVRTGGTLANDGSLAGRGVRLTASTLDNRGLIAGETIAFGGDRLTNRGAGAAIAAGGDMQLSPGLELSNLDGAWMSAEGRLSVGEAARPVGAILNRQSTIQSGGAMTVFAGQLVNDTTAPALTRVRQTAPQSVMNLYSLPRAHEFWYDCGSGGRDMCELNFPYVGKVTFTNGVYQDSYTKAGVTGTAEIRLLKDDTKRRVLTVQMAENGKPAGVRELPYFQAENGSYFYLDGYDPARDILPTRLVDSLVLTPARIAFHHTFGAAWRNTGLLFEGEVVEVFPKFAPVAGRDTVFPKAAPGPLTVTTTIATDTLAGPLASRANLLAGQDMTLTVDSLTNRYSTIAAQGDLTVTSRTPVANLGQALNRITTRTIVQGANTETEESAEQIGSVDAIMASRQTLGIAAPAIRNITHDAAVPAAPAAETPTGAGSVPPGSVGAPSRMAGSIRIGQTVPDDYLPPPGGLFAVHRAPGQRYLVETDPRFTSYAKFVSSDYMLKQLGHDPARLEKRLGDGYYEQQRIAQTITGLTGQRFLAGYADAMEQYQGLMNNGVEFARQFQLTPGIALTADQMRQLTRDMVWLEERVVNGETVLAPVVYLAGAQNAPAGQGAVMSGQRVALLADGELVNRGAIEGGEVLAQAGTIALAGGRVQAAGTVALNAAETLTLSGSATQEGRGAAIHGGAVWLGAGRDLAVSGSTVTASQAQHWKAGGALSLERAAIHSDGTFAATAGGDMTWFVSSLSSAGDAALAAGGALALTARQWSSRYGETLSGGNTRSRYASSEMWTEGSRLESAAGLSLTTGKDLTVEASRLAAGSALQATVGGDLRIRSTVDTRTERRDVDVGSKSYGFDSRRDFLNLASMTGASVDLAVRGRAELTGAELAGQNGAVTVRAGQDVTLNAVALTRSSFDYAKNGSYTRSRDVVQQGSRLDGRQAVSVLAGQDIETHAATLKSDGRAELAAGRDVRLDTALNEHSDERKTTGSKRGTFSSTKTVDIAINRSASEVGTLVSADSIGVAAGRDVAIRAGQVAGTQSVGLEAGRELTLQAGTVKNQVYQLHNEKTSGVFSGGGIGFTFGSKELTQTLDGKGVSESQNRALVGSVNGDLTLRAGDALTIRGSDVTAGKDVRVDARRQALEAGVDTWHSEQKTVSQSSGLTVQFTSPLINGLQAMASAAQTATETKDDRVKALSAATAAFAGYNSYAAYQQAMAGQNGHASNGLKISITVGGSHSETVTKNSSTTLAGSLLKAGGDLTLSATGGGADSSIRATAAQLLAGRDATLGADNAIELQSGQNSSEQHTTNRSASGGFGVAIAFQGGKPAFGFTANGSVGRGHSDGKDSRQVDTTLNAAGTVNLTSGGDTALKGAEVSGTTVVAKVGGNLDIQSRQDTSTFDSKNENLSADVTVGFGFSGSANYSYQRIKADYASVQRQSGIKAGDGGFQVTVGGNTNLTGAVIESHRAAIEAGRNSLTTGSLSASDIRNHADVSAVSISLGVGGSMGGSPGGSGPFGSSSMAFQNGASGSGAAAFADSHQSSTTTSGVSAGALTITGGQGAPAIDRTVSTETDSTHRLTNDFDQAKVQNALDVTMAFQQQASTFVANQIAKEKTAQLNLEKALAEQTRARDGADAAQQARAEAAVAEAWQDYSEAYDTAKAWGPGGGKGQLFTVLSAGFGGNAAGGMADVIQNGAVAYLQGLGAQEVKALAAKLEASGLSQSAAETVRGALHALTGCVGAAASGQNCGAGAMGGAAAVVLNTVLGGDTARMTPEEKRNREDIVSALVTGIALGSGQAASAGTALQAAKTEMENNGFSDSHFPVRGDKTIQEIVKKGEQVGSEKAVRTALDMLPVVGFLLSINDAKTAADVLLALPNLVPELQSLRALAREVQMALEAGNLVKANLVLSKARQEITRVCSAGACFVAGTPVWTDQGLKPIEAFAGGERVWARNDETGEFAFRPVVAHKATPDQVIYTVTIADQNGNEDLLRTTAEHPFWVRDWGWRKAALLQAGMTLLDGRDRPLTVVSVAQEPYTDVVYNIQVEAFHTYHVGELGTWVHNANCCGVRGGSASQVGKEGESRSSVVQVRSSSEKLLNALADFHSQRYQFGNNVYQLDKAGLKHVLERHHPGYWGGEAKSVQTFLDPKMTIVDVQNVIKEVMAQNRELLSSMHPYDTKQINGKVGGVEYVLGLRRGRIGQLYPK